MLCHRGCGLSSTYENYLGLPCCSKSAQSCPIVKSKIGKASGASRKGKKLTQEHKDNVSKGLTGRPVSTETREKIRNSNILTKSLQEITPWNKGLTAEDDERVAGYANTQRGQKRKEESLEILSRTDPIYSSIKKYRNRVSVRTRITYEKFKEELNPSNLKIGKCGVEDAHQVDHIISVREGFERGISVEEISSKENLQVIPWLDNIKKYGGINERSNKHKKGKTS